MVFSMQCFNDVIDLYGWLIINNMKWNVCIVNVMHACI